MTTSSSSKFHPGIQAARDDLKAGLITQGMHDALCKSILHEAQFGLLSRPVMPVPSFIQPKGHKQIQAEKNEGRDLSQARKVTAEEQLKREAEVKTAEKAAKKAARDAKKALNAAVNSSGKLEKAAEDKRIQVTLKRKDGFLMVNRFENGSEMLQAVRDLLLEQDCVEAVLDRGVVLTVWGQDGKATRKYYKNENAAHEAGMKSREKGAQSFSVSNKLTRGEMLAGMEPLKRDPVIPSRKKGPVMSKGRDYSQGNVSWQMRCSQTRVTSSRG